MDEKQRDMLAAVARDGLSRAANKYGLDYGALKELQTKFSGYRELVIPVGPVPDNYRALGREGLQHAVVAVKKVGALWPQRFLNAITDARLAYNAGTHEMCQQTRADGWVVLYSIRRRKPCGPRRYFFGPDHIRTDEFGSMSTERERPALADA